MLIIYFIKFVGILFGLTCAYVNAILVSKLRPNLTNAISAGEDLISLSKEIKNARNALRIQNQIQQKHNVVATTTPTANPKTMACPRKIGF